MSSSTPNFSIDHIGIVVPNLEEAVTFYTDVFGMEIDSREAPTDVNQKAIGIEHNHVRLCGTILRCGAARLEIHEYLEPIGKATRQPFEQGIGHFAFTVDDIHQAYEYLVGRGLNFNSEPNLIESGGLAGRWWVIGRDPWGNVIELGQDPAPKD